MVVGGTVGVIIDLFVSTFDHVSVKAEVAGVGGAEVVLSIVDHNSLVAEKSTLIVLRVVEVTTTVVSLVVETVLGVLVLKLADIDVGTGAGYPVGVDTLISEVILNRCFKGTCNKTVL